MSDARDLVLRLRSGKGSLSHALEFGRCMRTVAVGKLLVSARVADFLADLERSALLLAHFLATAEPETLAPGLAQPFFDAVASGARDVAAAIARATRRSWTPTVEYEDDYLYMRYLMGLNAGAERAALAPLLERYELVLDGADDARLSICRALHARDSAAFDAALGVLVESLHARYREQLAEEALDPDAAVTTALISIEALALVHLGCGEEVTCAPEHILVPSLARRTDLRKPLDADAWQEIGLDGITL